MHFAHDSVMALYDNVNICTLNSFFTILFIYSTCQSLVCLVRRTVGSGDISEPLAIVKCEVDDDLVGFNNNVIGGVSTAMALGNNSTTNNAYGNNAEVLDCVVCGDRATGRKANSNCSYCFHSTNIFYHR